MQLGFGRPRSAQQAERVRGHEALALLAPATRGDSLRVIGEPCPRSLQVSLDGPLAYAENSRHFRARQTPTPAQLHGLALPIRQVAEHVLEQRTQDAGLGGLVRADVRPV